jgi:hypothetical protein
MASFDEGLKGLNRLVGPWVTGATHPAVPGAVVYGSCVTEWLEGENFLIRRSRTDHADFPDSVAVLGFVGSDRVDEGGKVAGARGALTMSYFDSRGVARVYESSVDETRWAHRRNAKGFSQRFTGTFADGGATTIGASRLCEDGVHWADDLKVTFRRVSPRK